MPSCVPHSFLKFRRLGYQLGWERAGAGISPGLALSLRGFSWRKVLTGRCDMSGSKCQGLYVLRRACTKPKGQVTAEEVEMEALGSGNWLARRMVTKKMWL